MDELFAYNDSSRLSALQSIELLLNSPIKFLYFLIVIRHSFDINENKNTINIPFTMGTYGSVLFLYFLCRSAFIRSLPLIFFAQTTKNANELVCFCVPKKKLPIANSERLNLIRLFESIYGYVKPVTYAYKCMHFCVADLVKMSVSVGVGEHCTIVLMSFKCLCELKRI